MALYCPQCSRSYEDEVQCPRCALTLSSEPVREDPDDPLPPHWTRNPWGRTFLGVLLAQGLFFVIHEFALAGLVAASEGLTGTWANVSDILTVQAFQVAALLVGAILAGAGQRNGAVYGSFVGVWNGILSVLFQSLQGQQVTAVDFYSQPLLHTAFGGMGGVIGSWIWRPPSSYLLLPGKGRPGLPSAEFLAGVMAGQVSWFRVLAGVVLAVGGVLWADSILVFVLKASEGRMTIRNQLQQELMTYEIKALAVFFAGAISGASTWNGAVQGLWVGMLSAALILGTQFGNQSDLEVNTCIILASSVLILSTLGGAFGGKLLPPVARVNRRRLSPAPQ